MQQQLHSHPVLSVLGILLGQLSEHVIVHHERSRNKSKLNAFSFAIDHLIDPIQLELTDSVKQKTKRLHQEVHLLFGGPRLTWHHNNRHIPVFQD